MPKDPPLERKTAAALEASTGRRPAGTRSSHSLGLLKQEGFRYILVLAQ